jgi:predicted Zn-dependent protease
LAEARAGRSEAAVQTLGNALDRAPDQPLIYAALGRVWLDVARDRGDRAALAKALEALGRVAAGAGATSDVLTLFGRALLQDGQGALAERVLQQATTRYPIDRAAFLWFATAAEKQGHLEAARDALVRDGAVAPGEGDFVSRATRIAALSLRIGDALTATEWLRRAVDAAPNDVPLFVSLVDAQLKAGDREAAQAALARRLHEEPANPALLTLARRVANVPAPWDRPDRATRRREN